MPARRPWGRSPLERSEATELAALVERTAGLQPLRRLFHAGNGVMMALAPGALGLGRAETAGLLGAIVVLLFAGDLLRLRAARFNILFFRAFPSFASPREASRIASSTWYALGIFLTWALFPAPIAVPSILVLALADPAASVVGRLARGRPLGKGSWVGSAAFFLVAAAILVATVRHPLAPVAAALVAAVEVAPWRVDDNLSVPLSTALLLWALPT